MSGRVIAYTFDADVYCPDCAALAYKKNILVPSADYHKLPLGTDEHELPYALQDSEGNPVHAVFSTDDISAEGLWCGCCGALLSG